MAIFIKQGSTLIEMTERPYDAEAVLQQLVADHPALLAGEPADGESKRWLLVQRELGIADDADAGSRWSVDHLFLDERGIPTLVEVKRSSDTRIRREVVGQMLDYAANAGSYWGVETIRSAYEQSREALGLDPADDLAAHIGPDRDPEEYWEEVATNLDAGRLRLVFVADVIPHELRRIVEFLNAQMTRTDVLAIEIRQYVTPESDLITLVPRVIGQTEAARDAKRAAPARQRHRWGERELLEAWRSADPDGRGELMVRLYEALRDAGARLSWGTGTEPSVTAWLGERDDETNNPVSVGLYPNNIAINFDFVREARSEPEMHRLAALARSIPGVAAYINGLEDRNWGMHRGMRLSDVLVDDQAVTAWRTALLEASRPVDNPNRDRERGLRTELSDHPG